MIDRLGCGLVLLLVSVFFSPPAAAKTRADEAIERHLAKIDSGSKRDQKEVLSMLKRELGLMESDRKDPAKPGLDTREKLSASLITAFRRLDPSDLEQKGKIAELLAAYGWGTSAKALLYEIIEKEPKATRERVFSRLGRKDGPIDPEELLLKVNKWASAGLIEKKQRPGFLALFGRERAIPEIVEIVDRTNDREEFFYAAWALQDAGAVKELSRVFKRLRELRLDSKFKDSPDGLYWLRPETLEKFLRQAQGEDLILGLDMASIVPSAVTKSAVDIFLENLTNRDKRIRLLAAQRLSRAAENPRLDFVRLVSVVDAASKFEVDGEVKKGLENCRETLLRREKWAREFLKREQEWSKGGNR